VTTTPRELEVLLDDDEVFRRIFDANPMGSALVEPDGRLARVNESLCRFLGRAPDELVGLTLDDITDPRDLAADLELIRRLFAGDIDGYAIEKRYLLPDGSVAWGRLTASLIRDVEGGLLYAHGSVQDVTGEKDAQARAEQERLRLDLALSVASIATWEVDLRTGVITASENFAEVYGVPIADVAELVAHLHPDDRETVRRALDPTDRTFRPQVSMTFRTVTMAGEVRWIHARGAVVLDDDRRPVSMVGTGLDATGMRTALEGRLRAERLRRDTLRVAPTAFLAVDRRGAIVDWNEAASRLFGWSAAEATSGRVAVEELFDATARPHWVDHRSTILTGGREVATALAVARDGRRVPVEVVADVFHEGANRTVLAYVVDRSAVRDLHLELAEARSKDVLTGLDNRHSLLDQVAAAVAEVRRRRPIAIVLVRLDGDALGAVNEHDGYDTGDEVVRRQAARLAGLVGVAPLGRLDGTTFAALWADGGDAVRLAATVEQALAEPLALAGADGREVTVTASAVVALAEVDAGIRADAVLAEGERRLRDRRAAVRTTSP
jgi:PAS domain S-box-containing protein/diguanylate cyclase (GGDEF)-like protein